LHTHCHPTYKTHADTVIEALLSSYSTIDEFKSFTAAKRNKLSISLSAYNKVKAHVSDFKKTCKARYKDVMIRCTPIGGDKDKDEYDDDIVRDIQGKVTNSQQAEDLEAAFGNGSDYDWAIA